MPRQGESWRLEELVLVRTVFPAPQSILLISYAAVELRALIMSLFHGSVSLLGLNPLKYRGNDGSRPYDGLCAWPRGQRSAWRCVGLLFLGAASGLVPSPKALFIGQFVQIGLFETTLFPRPVF